MAAILQKAAVSVQRTTKHHLTMGRTGVMGNVCGEKRNAFMVKELMLKCFHLLDHYLNPSDLSFRNICQFETHNGVQRRWKQGL